MDGWLVRWMGWLDGMDGWMDGWDGMDGWMAGWDGCSDLNTKYDMIAKILGSIYQGLIKV